MVKIARIGFKDLLRFNKEKILDFENNVIVANASKEDLYLTRIFPIRTSFYMFVLIEKGSMMIELDYTIHHLTKQDILFILPDHVFLNIEASNDAAYKFIFVEQEYLDSMNVGRNNIFISQFIFLRKRPVIQLTNDEFDLLCACHERLKETITTAHHFKSDIVDVLIMEYVIESTNIIVKSNHQNMQLSNLSRKETYVRDFISLIKENILTEHNVKFYSEKLSVSPQYLSSILRKITGKGTKEWISDCLLIEAKIMLKYSQQSVQQIADVLQFYDQSAFSKFFKLHTGQTPKEYQKKY